MKTIRRKKEKEVKTEAAIAQVDHNLPKNEPSVITVDCPPPDYLEQEALLEPNRKILKDYVSTIRILREKGFSFREIADWLAERGIEADYNAVYRVYAKWVGDDVPDNEPLDD